MTQVETIVQTTIFSNCEFFIDYYSSQNGCDRSVHLGNELKKKYGARVVQQPNPTTTTHLIFKNGHDQTVLFARKYNIPLVDPVWLEHSIRKKRLISIEKYRVAYDENQLINDEINFDQLAISNKKPNQSSTGNNPISLFINVDKESHKNIKKALYTPSQFDFDQENIDQQCQNQPKKITVDYSDVKFSDNDKRMINRYGFSIVRRQQIFESPIKDENHQQYTVKTDDDSSMNELTVSQSSPVVHFTTTKRSIDNIFASAILSPSSTVDFDSQKQLEALGNRPQSTPKSSPVTSERTSRSKINKNKSLATLSTQKNPSDPSKVTTFNINDNSSLTKSAPIMKKNQNNDDLFFDAQEIIEEQDQIKHDDEIEKNFFVPRPPPLVALSQVIRRKQSDQLTDKKVFSSLSSKHCMPSSPANYSFVFYQFNSNQLEEATKLVNLMGDCFVSEMIDLSTTHVILFDDDPKIPVSLEFILALIYGCRFVTFDWLKSSIRIGEWLHLNKFEPKRFFQFNSTLNLYRRFRQQQNAIRLFNHCGPIYLTSRVKQRHTLLKLLTLLGANITINRNIAKIVVGCSSKTYSVEIFPQVTEKWAIDSILSGDCLSTENYLVDNETSK